MSTAIIMAGGRSLRMRPDSDGTHKALVKVLGVPMLERNILTLLSHDFREIFLAISTAEHALRAFAEGRATELARAADARLSLVIEKQPLGTIGAARAIRTRSEDVLVVNVDNLTALDLTAFLKHHQSRQATMTIATHTESFKMPFGQVSVKGGKIVAYKEKPVLPVVLSSGAYVLSREARRSIPPSTSVGAPELVAQLLRQGRRIEAFPHSSPWIDVNDRASVERAEQLIMTHSGSFELWRQPPDRAVALLCVLKGKAVAVLKEPVGPPSTTGVFPSLELAASEETPEHAVRQMSVGKLRIEKHRRLVSFDELDISTHRRTRYHLIVAEPARLRRAASVASDEHFQWCPLDGRSAPVPDCYVISRTFAYLRHYVASQNSHSVGH